jgi:branched-chain amino acid transport system permease protein
MRWRWISQPLTLILGVAVLVALAFAVPALSRTMTEALIFAILVVGLGVFIGNTGIVSFGHIAFAMIGAYAAAWQTCCPGIRQVFLPGLPDWLAALNVPLPLAAAVAMLLVGGVALAVGAILLRLTGTAASIGFLSFLFMVKTVFENWDEWTSGQSALVGLPLVVTPLAAGIGLALSILAAAAYRHSTSGLLVRAAREDEVAAQASGIRIWRERLLCLVLSAMIVALGGILLGHNIGSISVNTFWLDLTFLTIAMLVVGGRMSLTGAVVGAVAMTLLRDSLRWLEQGVETPWGEFALPAGMQEVGLALAVLLVLILRPQGLVGLWEADIFRHRQ